MGRHTKRSRLPAWAVGLIIAVLLSVLVFLVLSALGYGDDPVVETLGRFLPTS